MSVDHFQASQDSLLAASKELFQKARWNERASKVLARQAATEYQWAWRSLDLAKAHWLLTRSTKLRHQAYAWRDAARHLIGLRENIQEVKEGVA